MEENQEFSKILRDWYKKNHRVLPWRGTRDPYKIWLSEIILQQTRVDQGLPYFMRFVEAYPDIVRLADAHPDEVLRLWQGLGYYSRARNLHEAARQVRDQYSGVFPADYQALRKLKGIGDYTAAAIGSFAFDLPYPVVDGNVYRFLARFTGESTPIDSNPGKKKFAEIAASLFDPDHAAEHNQAMMELGATVCKPSNPACDCCPFSLACHAYIHGSVEVFPVKSKKNQTRQRFLHYFFFHDGQSLLLRQRTGKDIWQGLFEFPLLETDDEAIPSPLLLPGWTDKQVNTSEWQVVRLRHLLSHQELHASLQVIPCDVLPDLPGYLHVQQAELDRYALPRLLTRFLENWQRR